MHATQLDTWTKQLARTALETLKGSLDGFAATPALLGQVSQRVREVISRDLTRRSVDPRLHLGLAEELALAVYLTAAAEADDAELTPGVLAAMNLGLARTLDALARSAEPRAGLSQETTLSRESAMTDTGGAQ